MEKDAKIKKIVLNKSFVESAAPGEHRDCRTPGFCLRVSYKGKRTFFVSAKIGGTRINKTKKLGQFPDMLVDEAREAAQDLLRSLH